MQFPVLIRDGSSYSGQWLMQTLMVKVQKISVSGVLRDKSFIPHLSSLPQESVDVSEERAEMSVRNTGQGIQKQNPIFWT